MSKAELEKLEILLSQAAGGLKQVTTKKMFGCQALWADGNVFALVWKHGRLGVKLPNEESYDALLSIEGAAPWKAGPMKMAHWVLLPEEFHGKPAAIKKWATRAHSECISLPKKTAAKKSPRPVAKKR